MKGLIDITVALIGLIISYPLFIILDMIHNPAIYKGLRIGKNGKPFYMYKFRSMVVDAEQLGGASTTKNDERLTRIGKFIKRYKIDEVPQLINVLKGEMSLVGPRPEVPQFCMLKPDEHIIFTVKPGMTDWASLWNIHEEEALKGSDNPDKTYLEEIRPMKVGMQKFYVRNKSFCMDFSILRMTVRKLFC